MMAEAEPVFVHPEALVESDEVGEGTQVWAFAHIMKGAVVGRSCKVGDHAFIESGAVLGERVTVKNGCLIWHGVHIEDDVFVGPNVVFTNDPAPRVRYQTTAEDWLETHVGERASIGANSTILCGIRIGRNAMVGAGSVVTRDVPDHALVVGNPARRVGWACDCGTKLGDYFVCPECGRSYQESGMGLSEVIQSS
jgi:UDP-2-acetamido-3-amino-2,3-dideoxy-glucuronate N-acetyltransferase